MRLPGWIDDRLDGLLGGARDLAARLTDRAVPGRPGPGEEAAVPAPDDHLAHAAAGVEVLQRHWYREPTGLWRGTGWWNAANLTTVLVDYATVAGATGPHQALATTFERNRASFRGDFCNDYFDDEAWWALAWMRAHDLTGEGRYLDTSRAVFADLVGAWDGTCGGGVWWSRARDYKNAIANELFLAVAAGLHLRTGGGAGPGGAYLDWARRAWAWFDASGMRGERGLINDGLRDCVNNGGITWTYNQGVILGGLVALYDATGDAGLLRDAETIADAAIANLVTPDGVLAEPCARPDRDQVQFKGIFCRNLADLHRATGHERYAAFLRHNAERIVTGARDHAGRFGFDWSGPPSLVNAATHGSALDAIVAAARTARPGTGQPDAPG